MHLARLVSKSVYVALRKENLTLDPVEQAGQRGCPLVHRIHDLSGKRWKVMRAVGCVIVADKDASLSQRRLLACKVNVSLSK